MSLKQRYLLLLALRWFPTGMLLPVAALLPFERGLTLGEIGTAMAAQGVMVLLLEIPSGALSDSWGRRPVFIASAVVAVIAYALTLAAASFLAFALAWAVTGVFRALNSGALESWFVDAENARGAAHEVPSGLAAAGGVISTAIGLGSLAAAGLLVWSPWSTATTLAAPYGAAMGLVLVQLVVAIAIMNDTPPHPSATSPAARWARTVREGVHVATGPAVRGLVAAMLLIAVGVAALGFFMPIRLAELSGDNTRAAAQMGVVAAMAWGFAAIGAAITSRVLRRRASRWVAVVLVVAQAVALGLMAIAAAPTALIAGFWLGYLVHTAYSATYNSLIHARVDDAHRTTALSIASMAFLGSASAAGALLGVLAEHTSSSTSLVVGAVALVLAAAIIAVATRSRPGSCQRA